MLRARQVKYIGWHLLGWALFFGTIILFVTNAGAQSHVPQLLEWHFLVFVAMYLFLFYFNTYVLLPRLYFRQHYLAYFVVAFLLLAGVFVIQPFDKLVALHAGMQIGGPGGEAENRPPNAPPKDGPPDGQPPGPPPPKPTGENGSADTTQPHPEPFREGPQGLQRQRLDIVSVVLFMAVWSAGSVLQIFRQWRITEKRAARAEADKMSAELSFLKAQINPHFLFNTLNNIYSLATVKSDHTPDAIMKLSSILRYITDDVRADFVPLQMEVDCVKNYIALQQLRISKKVIVDFGVGGEMDDKKVAPLVFMTFIENTFKYGISNREASIITIRITSDKQVLNLYCRNKIIRTESEESTGVGITNARRRLDFLYPNKHRLLIDSADGYFTVDLSIIT